MSETPFRLAPLYTVGEVSPLVPPQLVPTGALQAIAASANDLTHPTAVIELAVATQDSALLKTAADDLTQRRDHPFFGGRASLHLDYMPVYQAMVENRTPTMSELAITAQGVRQTIQTLYELVVMPDDELAALYPQRITRAPVVNLRNYPSGELGEAQTLDLSLGNAIVNQGDLLVPSSRREEHSWQEVSTAIGNHNHDMFVYNAPLDMAAAYERVRLDVKTSGLHKSMVGGTSSVLFRVLQRYREAVATVDAIHHGAVNLDGISDVVDRLQSDTAVRSLMRLSLQATLDSATPVSIKSTDIASNIR